jgi:cytoskeletal protein CcmA (bactofilin family)
MFNVLRSINMFNKKKLPPIKSLIAEGSQIDGNFSFEEGLRIDGAVVGNVSAKSEFPSILVVSETATVAGEIHADHIIINGTVKGPVHARVMLELQPKARIHGDVHYMALEMHQGALIAGQLRPIIEDEEKPTLKLAANNR